MTGKANLPVQLRQKFTEIYVPEMTARPDLQQLVLSYLWPVSQEPPADAVVDFYLAARKEAVSGCTLVQTLSTALLRALLSNWSLWPTA